MAWWTHRTKTGRIVYERAPNRFTYCDIYRILSAIDPITLLDLDRPVFRSLDRLGLQYICLLGIYIQTWGHMARAGLTNIRTLAELATFNFEALILEKLRNDGISSSEELFGQMLANTMEEVKWLRELAGQSSEIS